MANENKVIVTRDKLDALADSISAKSGESLPMTIAQMKNAVDRIDISGGGITPTGTKNISITQNGTTTEDVTAYANAEISVNVVNQDYEDALVALGTQSDLTDGIEALTTYSNSVTGESDTTLSDAVHTLGSGYGGGSGGISDGYEIKTLDANDCPTAVDHYGTKVHRQQYWNRTSTDGFWKNLESVTFKDTVTSFGAYAFGACSKITSLDFSAVTEIGSYAFQNCTGFTAINLPELTALSPFMLMGCSNLVTFIAPKCVSGNAQRVFEGCSSLQNIQLGSIGYGVPAIHQYTFFRLTQSTLTITIYTTGNKVDDILSKNNNSNGATNATFIFKASEATTYNGTSYAAGDTMLTSTP